MAKQIFLLDLDVSSHQLSVTMSNPTLFIISESILLNLNLLRLHSKIDPCHCTSVYITLYPIYYCLHKSVLVVIIAYVKLYWVKAY